MHSMFIENLMPVPKARPRFSGHAYTPAKTAAYERIIAAEWKHGILCPTSGALRITMCFEFPIPGSWSKKKKAAALGTRHNKKPDLDNLVKAILDSLNGVAYDDDSVIAEICAKKIYAEEPSVFVMIDEAAGEL